MSEIKNELKEAEKKIATITTAFEAVSDKLEALQEAIDCCETTNFANEKDEEKLTKKQRKEKAKAFLKQKFPKLFSELQEIKELIDSVSFEVDEIAGDAETAIENIGEAEQLIEEAREKLDRF
jgi:chromosome segregation ATPase